MIKQHARFFVPSRPVTQGNHRTRKTPGGRMRAYETTKGHRAWRDAVCLIARSEWKGQAPIDGAAVLSVAFFVPPTKGARPGNLPATSGGDISKLIRSVEDALADGGVLKNDRRITDCAAIRRFAFPPQDVGCMIEISAWSPDVELEVLFSD